MKYILGVDAAWTYTNPTGIALVQADATELSAVFVARSYAEFLAGRRDWSVSPKGTPPDFKAILEKCKSKGISVDLVALDIPLSPKPITTRRESDIQISRLYGGRGAATHSPTPQRPGVVSEIIFSQLMQQGYHWNGDSSVHSFIEVYPHTAILELFGYSYRLAYKVQNRAKYWRELSSQQQMINVIKNMNELRQKIIEKIPNVSVKLPEAKIDMDIVTLKSIEDALDALICALTGFSYMQGKVKRYGDDTSGIWVPIG